MVILFKPDAELVQNLKVGDTVPDTFGGFSEITKIFAQQQAINGEWFCCYYTWFSPNSFISDSIRQDSLLRTLQLSKHFTSHELDIIESKLPSGIFDAMSPDKIRDKFLS